MALQKIKQFLSDEKEEFKSTKYSNCLISIKEKSDTLVVNKNAMGTLHSTFGRVISLTGRPGVGKSTLASMIYNMMRNDKVNYFEISDCMESFTKGIWSLNKNTKGSKADCDNHYGFDILDLEGLGNKNSIHYLLVVAMALSDGIVLCDLGKRFNFEALDTIIAGLRIYREKKIHLPPPTIYIQVNHGKKKFKINKENIVDRDGLIAYIIQKYPEFDGVELHPFSVDFDDDEDDRFHGDYIKTVQAFMGELKNIPERDVKIEDRVKYAIEMVKALNNNSPAMIVKLNYKFFTEKVNQIANEAEASAKTKIKLEADNVAKTINKKISFGNFCSLICQNGKLYYGQSIIQQATKLSFYDRKDANIRKFVNKYHDENDKYSVYAKDFCLNSYDEAMIKLKSLMITKRNDLMIENDKAFKAFVDMEVATAIHQIKFNGHTYLPHGVRQKIQRKQHEFRIEIIEKTQEMVELDDDYLSMNILSSKWETKVNILKADWEERKTVALGARKRKVTTFGNYKCSHCGKVGGDGLTHRSCTNSIYYWVDGETGYHICDTCKALSNSKIIVCSNCQQRMDLQIVPIN